MKSGNAKKKVIQLGLSILFAVCAVGCTATSFTADFRERLVHLHTRQTGFIERVCTFLIAVDNSGSMGGNQSDLQAGAAAIASSAYAQRNPNAQVIIITTDYDPNSALFRLPEQTSPRNRNPIVWRGTLGSPELPSRFIVGTNGSGNEAALGSLVKYTQDLGSEIPNQCLIVSFITDEPAQKDSPRVGGQPGESQPGLPVPSEFKTYFDNFMLSKTGNANDWRIVAVYDHNVSSQTVGNTTVGNGPVTFTKIPFFCLAGGLTGCEPGVSPGGLAIHFAAGWATNFFNAVLSEASSFGAPTFTTVLTFLERADLSRISVERVDQWGNRVPVPSTVYTAQHEGSQTKLTFNSAWVQALPPNAGSLVSIKFFPEGSR